jgi:nucleotide-binding universal stress UspA family protein
MLRAPAAGMSSFPPFSRILVATDLHVDSQEAIVQGDVLARAFHAALGVVTVAPPSYPAEAFASVSDSARSVLEARQVERASDLETLVLELTGRERHAYAGFVEQGGVTEHVLSRAEAWHCDLLVVGTHDRRGIGHFVLGSEAEILVRRAHCSALVARRSPASGAVIVACDLDGDTLGLVAVASKIAEARRVPLVVVHAVDVRPSDVQLAASAVFSGQLPLLPDVAAQENTHAVARAALEAALAAEKANGTIELPDGPASSAVVMRARAHEASLVVVGTSGRRGLARLALGSVAETIARDAACSVLVVRPGATA